MNPDRTGRKVVCGEATPATTMLDIVEAGLHWNRFNFMSMAPRLFFPSPTILHSDKVVQPFMAAFRDSPPMQGKYKKYMLCIRGSNPQHYSHPGQCSPHFQPKNCPLHSLHPVVSKPTSSVCSHPLNKAEETARPSWLIWNTNGLTFVFFLSAEYRWLLKILSI